MSDSQTHPPTRILIAEDNKFSRRLLEATIVKWNYEVVATNDGKEALQVLQSKNPPRIAVLDWLMPGMDGIDVCRVIRKRGGEPYIYIIMLSSKVEKEDIIEGMNAGADDYVSKPFNSAELRVRIKAGNRIITLEQDLIKARNQLHMQATHDALTGIWNRAAIMDAMRKEICRAVREKKPIALMMADIDFFKRINDSHGHPAGDSVLCAVSRRMQSSLRAYDSLGRYGGEEFLVILPGCNKENAFQVAERIRLNVSTEETSITGRVLTVTISAGIAVISNPESIQPDIFLKKADEALYAAKENGRNRVEVKMLPYPAKGQTKI